MYSHGKYPLDGIADRPLASTPGRDFTLAQVVEANTLRQEILVRGVPFADLNDYEVLTLKLAEAVPNLLKKICD